MLSYLLVAVATVLLAFDFALNKKYQQSQGVGLAPALRFNALNGLLTAVIFFFLNGMQVQFSWFSLLMSFWMTVMCVAYSILGFRIMKLGGMTQHTLFLMGGGMILPYIFGVIFLDESLSAARIVGLVLIIAALLLTNGGKITAKGSVLLLCICVFFFNGIGSIISKCHQISTTHGVSSTGFVALVGMWKCLISLAVLLLSKNRTGVSFPSFKGVIPVIVASALAGGISYMLQLIGASDLPASVLYPLVTGGSIIFTAIADAVFFKQKLSRQQIISIALCFTGTLLFL